MDAHDYCRYLLKASRIEGEDASIKIPRISSSKLSPDSYAVFIGRHHYSEHGCCCAFYARAEAINDFIESNS